ncbi:MAG TPA: MFS transporter [Candidatus Limnocylindrales bacterium]|jgi:MFS family permease
MAEAFRGAARSIRAAIANPAIRRVEAAYTVGIAGDWVLLVALLVVAYQAGGPLTVGVLGLVRMVPATVTGTLAGIPAARFGSGRVLLAANILRTVGALGCAVGVGIGAPTAIVFLAAAVVASAGLLVRPVQSALLPSLARLPEELVAGNVVSSLGEAVGTFIGPLLGGILVAAVSEAAAMSVASGLFVLAAISVARLDAVEDRGAEVPSDQAMIGQPSFLRSVRTVARRPGPALVLLGFLSQVLVRGMLITLIVVASIELLGLGRAGIGWLNAAIGLGGLIGAIGAASLGRGIRLSRVFALSLAMWGLPIAVMGAWPVPLVALGAMVVTGLSNASLDISGFTVLQRSFPPRERFAAFGLLEGAGGFGLAVGGIIASIVLDRVGIRGALALAGALLPITAVATWPRISRLELESLVPEARLDLVRRVPLFAPLNLSTLERLASTMVPIDAAPGDVLMREGDVGDRYLVIETGSVAVSSEGRPLRTCGPGEGIGEIALLRDIPRTATVVAVEPTRVLALDALSFKAAMAGPAAWAAAEATMADRLGTSGPPADP